MNKIFVDTGGWVGLFNKKDKFHKEANGIYAKIKSDRLTIYTSDYVVDETLTLIKKRGNSADAIVAGEALMESKVVNIINIDADLFNKAWLNFQRYCDKDLSFTDASTVTVMNNLKIMNLFAFDNSLISLGFVKYE